MSSPFAIDIPSSLIDGARRRDARAFEHLYRLFERPVYTLALRMMGREADAQDILQEAFLAAFERLHQYRGEAGFGFWLRGIVANAALMRLRSQRPMDDLESLPEVVAGERDERQALAAAKDLESALALLPPLSRSILWLYHVEEYTHEEIAELFGKTASFSKSQVARAAARLRRHYAQEDSTWTPSTIAISL